MTTGCALSFSMLPLPVYLRIHSPCISSDSLPLSVQSFGVPTIVLGGGGYTIRNVARCWANETAVVLDETLPDFIPPNEYVEFYRPDYRLHLEPAGESQRGQSVSRL